LFRAGYIGAMTFGRCCWFCSRAVAARIVLLGSAGIVLALTLIFGVVKPLFAGAWLSLSGLPFTLLAVFCQQAFLRWRALRTAGSLLCR
jgi:hypothetical protein